ncbi:MAG: translocation/assembly module TamB domain-containing protein [Rudaea sp.]|nr:translocation/assembly module TamB domain-containing protein [Rudaea sp.]
MKWLRRLGIGFGILFAIFVASAIWLLESESGARFALERAKAAFADKLSIAQSGGALAGPLEIHGLRYRDPAAGIDISIQNIKVDCSLSALFGKTLHVGNLQADGVVVALTTVAPAAVVAPVPSIRSLLTPPLAILIDGMHAGNISISQDGRRVFIADSLDLAATWTGSALSVQRLALRGPDGKVDLNGALASYADYRGKARLDFDWRVEPQRFAGTLDIGNDGTSALFALALNQPTRVAATATLATRADTLPWTLDLDVPSFDPGQIAQNDTLKTLALKLQGSGDRTRGVLTGNVDLNAHRLLLDPLQFALAGQTLTMQNLHLHSPEASGTLSAKGKLQLDAKPIGGDLDLTWTDVELPADLAGQALATHGSLHADGNAGKFAAQGEFSLGPPGKPVDFAIRLDGTPQIIALRQFDLKQARGGLNASGEIVLLPLLGWRLDARANRLDPGAFAKDWPGSIDFTLSTSGRMEKDGPAGNLRLDSLGGTLRQRPLRGNADLNFAPPLAVDGVLMLASGKSSIALRGKSGAQTDVEVNLSIASLGDWIPQAGGSLRGDIALLGSWPRLAARGKIEASKIAFGDIHADALALDVDAGDLSAPGGTVNLDAKALSIGGHVFDTLKLDVRGNRAAHTFALDAYGPQLGVTVAIDGSLAQGSNDWRGTLTALSLAPASQSAWTLGKPAPLTYAKGDFSLGDLCLDSTDAEVCASATQAAAGNAQAKFMLRHLLLASIVRLASPDAVIKLDGIVDGNGDIARGADGALNGHATLTSASGSIAYPDDAGQPLVAYQDFHIDASLAPQQSAIDMHASLDNGGRLDGHIALGAATAGGMPLSGEVSANLANLGFIDLLGGQTSATQGKLDTRLVLSGTTLAPGVAGQLTLTDFASEIPAAGLKLHDGRIGLRSGDGRSFAVDGSVGSGDGKLALSGDLGVAADAPIAIRISGENFLAADIPGAQVRISPELALARDAGTYTITGTVTIPKADVDLGKLPGGGAAKTSPDIVVTDAQSTPAAAGLLLDADITVKLGAGEKLDLDLRQGREVHLVGFGLDGYLGGQLAVQERPGHATSGRGQVVVNGTYKAYGQDLTIDQGRLLFAGTPIDNPGLDLRATRAFTDPDVTVGLQIRGTAQVPVLTVFSNPAMEQSDALSYLVAGKPMSQLKSGEGDAVGSAARALGTAGGDLLAKSIGNRMGLDDVGVADSSAVGGAALTVGKYLSPRLYLSYGVGLFTPGEVVTLRYRLTRLFNIEIQNGTLSSRAGINYKIEK